MKVVVYSLALKTKETPNPQVKKKPIPLNKVESMNMPEHNEGDM